MPLAPPKRGKLTVTSGTPWKLIIFYRDKAGKRVDVKNYQEARDYAAANGYTGIIIERA